mmetsp:Transcript_685/g.931  ORF Transcript_685/g.931 Transcript_685/m.931 type:complete len:841 (-) Transcript_685:74-2596(-)
MRCAQWVCRRAAGGPFAPQASIPRNLRHFSKGPDISIDNFLNDLTISGGEGKSAHNAGKRKPKGIKGTSKGVDKIKQDILKRRPESSGFFHKKNMAPKKTKPDVIRDFLNGGRDRRHESKQQHYLKEMEKMEKQGQPEKKNIGNEHFQNLVRAEERELKSDGPVLKQVTLMNVKNRRRRKMPRLLRSEDTSSVKQVFLNPKGMVTLREFSRRTKLSIERINETLEEELERESMGPHEYLDFETMELIGVSTGITVSAEKDGDRIPTACPEERDHLQPKPPVVCIMGHVNHGKTSLLDQLRSSNVVDEEAGGITQSLGAFMVNRNGVEMCVLDTPGHSVFRGMRSKGCQATDVVVLIVSAPDGIQEQTIESIELAQRHAVPIIVAINKCDLDGVDVDSVKGQLMDYGVVVEELGGDVITCEISAKTGEGIDDLVEAIQMVAEVENLRVDAKAKGEFVVLETAFMKGKGAILNSVVRWGTLNVGDVFVCGKEYGKVRELVDGRGKKIKKAGPSTPVAVFGLRGEDSLSDEGLVVNDEKTARKVVDFRADQAAYDSIYKARVEAQETIKKEMNEKEKDNNVTEQEKMMRRRAQASPKLDVATDDIEADDDTLYCIVKADCQGSLEAILDYFQVLPDDKIKTKVVKCGIGPPSISDLEQAEILNHCHMILFNTKPSGQIEKVAIEKKVPMSTHDVIYDLMDTVRDLLSSRLPPKKEINVLGTAEFVQALKLNTRGRKTTIAAGVRVRSGMLKKSASWRVVRNKEVVFEVEAASSMRHFKDDVETMGKGEECGVLLSGFQDYEDDDILQCFEIEEISQVFDDSVARRQQHQSDEFESDTYSSYAH